jgi:hypothetical protein
MHRGAGIGFFTIREPVVGANAVASAEHVLAVIPKPIRSDDPLRLAHRLAYQFLDIVEERNEILVIRKNSRFTAKPGRPEADAFSGKAPVDDAMGCR